MSLADIRWQKILTSNMAVGIGGGLFMAAMYCAVALFIFLVRGHQPFDRNGTTLLRVLATYLISGVSAGFVVGLILPLARWMLGAAVVGFLAAFIVWLLVGYSNEPQEPLLSLARTACVLGGAFGLPIGVGYWFQVRKYRRTGKW